MSSPPEGRGRDPSHAGWGISDASDSSRNSAGGTPGPGSFDDMKTMRFPSLSRVITSVLLESVVEIEL